MGSDHGDMDQSGFAYPSKAEFERLTTTCSKGCAATANDRLTFVRFVMEEIERKLDDISGAVKLEMSSTWSCSMPQTHASKLSTAPPWREGLSSYLQEA